MEKPGTEAETYIYYPSEVPDGWVAYAECRLAPPGAMSPNATGSRTERSAEEKWLIALYCANCCVQEECFDDALRTGADDGIRGGVTQPERKSLHAEFVKNKFVRLPKEFFEKTLQSEAAIEGQQKEPEEAVEAPATQSLPAASEEKPVEAPAETPKHKPARASAAQPIARPATQVASRQRKQRRQAASKRAAKPTKALGSSPLKRQWKTGPSHEAILTYLAGQPNQEIECSTATVYQLLSDALGFSRTNIQMGLIRLRYAKKVESVRNPGAKVIGLRLHRE